MDPFGVKARFISLCLRRASVSASTVINRFSLNHYVKTGLRHSGWDLPQLLHTPGASFSPWDGKRTSSQKSCGHLFGPKSSQRGSTFIIEIQMWIPVSPHSFPAAPGSGGRRGSGWTGPPGTEEPDSGRARSSAVGRVVARGSGIRSPGLGACTFLRRQSRTDAHSCCARAWVGSQPKGWRCLGVVRDPERRVQRCQGTRFATELADTDRNVFAANRPEGNKTLPQRVFLISKEQPRLVLPGPSSSPLGNPNLFYNVGRSFAISARLSTTDGHVHVPPAPRHGCASPAAARTRPTGGTGRGHRASPPPHGAAPRRSAR